MDFEFNVQGWAQARGVVFGSAAVFAVLCDYRGSHGEPDAEKEAKVERKIK